MTDDGGAIGARVNALEGGFTTIRSDIAELRNLVVSNQKTPWSTLIAAAGFIVLVTTAFSQLSLQPIRDAENRDSKDIFALNSTVVSRGELQGHWDIQAAQITNLQKQVDQQRSDFGSTYSLRDALADMQKKIEKLEDDHAGRKL